MGHFTEQLTPLWDWFWADPLRGSAAVACLIAIASTPLVFLILGRKEYLHTRRGRTYRKPEWWSVVCSMALVMGIPGIVLVLLVKSQYFDEDRYAFDPNETWSVIEQGRQYETAKQLSKAAEEEYQRLQKERQRLVEGIKELDQAMIGLRATADRVPPVAQSLPEVLESLAEVRKAVGVDAPQQLVDYKAPPIELAEQQSANPYAGMMMPPSADWANRGAQPAEPQGPGLSQAERETELASVPKPQKELAALLPLTDIPEGWAVGESGDRYIETFNADNLYEKINGRAESFLQYDVTGMAYSYYQPDEDDSGEVQLYIFDMSTPLNALGKYGTEKPAEGIEPLEQLLGHRDADNAHMLRERARNIKDC